MIHQLTVGVKVYMDFNLDFIFEVERERTFNQIMLSLEIPGLTNVYLLCMSQ